jgi:hypothetical protein
MASDDEHMPRDDPWPGAGVPESGFWTDDRIEKADELVLDFLDSSFHRVVRHGLAAEERRIHRAGASRVTFVAVSNEFNEVAPIRYDKRCLRRLVTEEAVRHARGEDDGE